jgi:hypothetical protein
VSPLELVGHPDWRSAVLALAFAAPWLVLLAGRWLRRPWVWVVAVVSAVLFSLSIAWVQVPIQQVINRLYAQKLSTGAIQQYLLLLGVPIVVIAGLVQEVVKFVIAVAGLYLIRAHGSPRGGLALGAAAGAGYGAAEAFWIFNEIFVAGFTWATVQLHGPIVLLGFIERVFSVMFHIGAASLAAYGFAVGRPWRFLLLAIGLHSLLDYVAVLGQAQLLSAVTLEIPVAVIAIATMAFALCTRFRTGPSAGEQERGPETGL